MGKTIIPGRDVLAHAIRSKAAQTGVMSQSGRTRRTGVGRRLRSTSGWIDGKVGAVEAADVEERCMCGLTGVQVREVV